LLVDLADPLGKFPATTCPWALGALQPGVLPAATDLQHAAVRSDRPEMAMVVDEVISHGDSLAKKAVADFKISRSIVSRCFSSRSRHSLGCATP
jgi:hypothetical protein